MQGRDRFEPVLRSATLSTGVSLLVTGRQQRHCKPRLPRGRAGGQYESAWASQRSHLLEQTLLQSHCWSFAPLDGGSVSSWWKGVSPPAVARSPSAPSASEPCMAAMAPGSCLVDTASMANACTGGFWRRVLALSAGRSWQARPSDIVLAAAAVVPASRQRWFLKCCPTFIDTSSASQLKWCQSSCVRIMECGFSVAALIFGLFH